MRWCSPTQHSPGREVQDAEGRRDGGSDQAGDPGEVDHQGHQVPHQPRPAQFIIGGPGGRLRPDRPARSSSTATGGLGPSRRRRLPPARNPSKGRPFRAAYAARATWAKNIRRRRPGQAPAKCRSATPSAWPSRPRSSSPTFGTGAIPDEKMEKAGAQAISTCAPTGHRQDARPDPPDVPGHRLLRATSAASPTDVTPAERREVHRLLLGKRPTRPRR